MTKKSETQTAASATKNTATKTANQEILQQLQAANIDSQTAAQFSGLTLIRQARISQLQRQAASMTALRGATDPGVVALQASIQSQQSLASQLGAVRDQALTPVPSVPANGWVLHGRVRDQNLQPVAQLTVLLLNEQKTWLRTYGYAYTDPTGYFILSYAPAESRKSDLAASLSAYLEVLDQKREPLYIDGSAFTLSTGATLYRDIVLASLTTLGNPPPGATSASPEQS
jgi:hypothetical protein